MKKRMTEQEIQDAKARGDELTRIVQFAPAFDHGPQGGCHGVELRFVLKGPLGAVQLLVFTQWMLPETQDRTDAMCLERGVDATTLHALYRPLAADLGYHSPKPLYEGQEPMRHIYRAPRFEMTPQFDAEGGFQETYKHTPGVYGDPLICPFIDGDRPCYYEGSTVAAEPVFERLLREGDEGVWDALEECYREQFPGRL